MNVSVRGYILHLTKQRGLKMAIIGSDAPEFYKLVSIILIYLKMPVYAIWKVQNQKLRLEYPYMSNFLSQDHTNLKC
jgi:hypothetical protein